ncbi:MAG: hypothetical protein ER33_05410 [Cyanobium sp. CACIAM 14]|nr:MAG: hypothetical protein ER33_05410 [Cyanobium sp. CACIAM 14]
MLLGISGPLVSLAIFLVLATAGSVRLADKARNQISAMFDQDNRSALAITTSIIQKTSEEIDKELNEDAQELRQLLQPLTIDSRGAFFWEGRPLRPDDAARTLNDRLRLPLALRQERASIYYEDAAGRWRRLTGITSRGEALKPGWEAPDETVRQFRSLFDEGRRPDQPHKAMVHRDGEWMMASMMRLPSGHPSGRRMVLLLAVHTDAATKLLAAGTSLFPYRTHQTAFFGFTPTGAIFCSYESPHSRACEGLQQALAQSGGIPYPGHQQGARSAPISGQIFERESSLPPPGGRRPVLQHLYIATFPNWHWLAVIAVQANALEAALTPMKEAVARMIQFLVALTLILIGASGVAAWIITRGIRRELRQLAAAADAIADGQGHQTLVYGADDAIGRLVRAFNRMSGAVEERENSLRAQIRQLEINISASDLQGQVCSILSDPGFESLSARAQAMRRRRQEQISASGPAAPAAGESGRDGPPLR